MTDKNPHSGSINDLLDEETGPRNIPQVKFIEDVAKYLKNREVEVVLRDLHELHTKFQYMERSLSAQKKSLEAKLPDIEEAFETVDHLKKNADSSLKAHFALSDNLLAKAEIPPTTSVFLWLGANILLEYPMNEAAEMLNANHVNAEKGIAELNVGLEHLRVQLTTTEVNIARFHNHGVAVRHQRKMIPA